MFTAAAMVLILAVGLVVWAVSSSYLLTLRQQGAVRQAQVTAGVMQRLLVPRDPDLEQFTRELADLNESAVLVMSADQAVARAGLTIEQVPPPLRQLVESGTPARQRVLIDDETRLLVGIPIATADASYYQSFPLRRLDSALHSLRTTLVLAGAAAVLLAALLGWLATRRALRPVDELTAAARAIASGRLATRLPEDDPDLAEIASVFNATAAALESRVRADARFASNVSHELRTPLMTMANALTLLERRRHQLPEVAREAVDLLGSQLARFERFVLDLLEISVVTEGTQNWRVQEVDLAHLVCALATAQEWRAPEVLDEPLVVQADPRRLERILSNLVSNAHDHGGGLVRLAVLRRGQRARVEVDDAGPGVPEEARARIFERFERGMGERHAHGAGIGLALVAELTALHRGQVWVEERPGGGARFVLELPGALDG